MDPASWSNDLTELERQLLEAGRNVQVPEALSARMAEGLQIGSASLAGGTTAIKLGAPLLVKAGLWGVLSLGLAVATVSWYTADPAPVQPTAAPPARVVEPAVAHAPAPAFEPPESRGDPAPTRATSRPPRQAKAATPLDDNALRAEVALLARARQALQQKATARAQQLLDQHRARFGQGTLAPEAAALRIEALIQEGSYELAQTKTAQFMKAYPKHPLHAHVASMLQAHTASAPAR